MSEAWDYLEKEPAHDAPEADNLSGMYCPSCRFVGAAHCAHPEWCGGMRLMKPQTIFGPRFEKGVMINRKDDGRCGFVQAERFGDYISVKWNDGATSWVRCAILRIVPTGG
jgi:hypothetical protein